MHEWLLFEEEFGPLTVHERIDCAAALVAFSGHRSAGGKGRLEDFMPQWRSSQKIEITDWLSAMARRN